MRQGHRPYSQLVVHPQHSQIVVDRVTALDCEKGCDLAGLHDPLDVGRRGRVFDLVSVFVEERLHRVSKIQRPAYCFRTWKIRGNPQREEWRMRAPLVQPWNIDVTYIPPFGQVRKQSAGRWIFETR